MKILTITNLTHSIEIWSLLILNPKQVYFYDFVTQKRAISGVFKEQIDETKSSPSFVLVRSANIGMHGNYTCKVKSEISCSEMDTKLIIINGKTSAINLFFRFHPFLCLRGHHEMHETKPAVSLQPPLSGLFMPSYPVLFTLLLGPHITIWSDLIYSSFSRSLILALLFFLTFIHSILCSITRCLQGERLDYVLRYGSL